MGRHTQYFANLRSVEVIEVIQTKVYEGEGTPESMGRLVTYYTRLDGTSLAVHDPNGVISRPDQQLKKVP